MRKYSAIVVVCVAAVGALLVLAPPVGAVPAPTPKKFVGTALNVITFTAGDRQIVFPSLSTIHTDGTLTATDANDFVQDDMTAFNGPARGSWEKIGPNTIRGVSIYHAFDAAGGLVYTGRSDFESTLAGDDAPYDASGEGVVRIYFPDMDPLDKDSGIVIGTFTITSRRVEP